MSSLSLAKSISRLQHQPTDQVFDKFLPFLVRERFLMESHRQSQPIHSFLECNHGPLVVPHLASICLFRSAYITY